MRNSGIFALIAGLCLAMANPAKAVFINPTILVDTPTLFEAFVDHQAPLSGTTLTIGGTNWRFDVNDAGGHLWINNVQHLVDPHAGETVPNFGPNFTFFNVTPGTLYAGFSPNPFGFGGSHNSHQDATTGRYDVFGPPGNSRLSIRLAHNIPPQGTAAPSAPFIALAGPGAPVTAVAEPATLALFGLGLAGLGLVRRRKAA